MAQRIHYRSSPAIEALAAARAALQKGLAGHKDGVHAAREHLDTLEETSAPSATMSMPGAEGGGVAEAEGHSSGANLGKDDVDLDSFIDIQLDALRRLQAGC